LSVAAVSGNLIDGEWHTPPTLREVTNPSNRTVVGCVGYGGAAEATLAADAAARAFPGWSATPARVRADVLLAGAHRLAERVEEIGMLLCQETGKRLVEACAEVAFAVEYLRWFAEQTRRPVGTLHRHEHPGRRHVSLRVPSGVVVTLTPWNFPVSIQARKVAPALAAGCCVVTRPSEKAPLAVIEMVRCLNDAGLPPGVLNLVHGPAAEVTDALITHDAVRVVSFTGSTRVGRDVMAGASRRIVRPLLELGGDAPFIVFADADMDSAVEGAMIAKFRNNGQSCVAANRFFVHSDVYEEFVARVAARIDSMTIGDPVGAAAPHLGPQLGPLIDDDRVRAVSDMVEQALREGARVVTKERGVPGDGSYCAPVLLTGVPDNAAFATSEVFGPAAGVFSFDTDDEALTRANATEMGLAGYVYTQDAARIWRIAEQLDVGIVGINDPLPSVAFAPMGGTKQSGLGREGAEAGLEEFEEIRYLCMGI